MLTPIGLLPIVCAGINIQDFVKGFPEMAIALAKAGFEDENASITKRIENMEQKRIG